MNQNNQKYEENPYAVPLENKEYRPVFPIFNKVGIRRDWGIGILIVVALILTAVFIRSVSTKHIKKDLLAIQEEIQAQRRITEQLEAELAEVQSIGYYGTQALDSGLELPHEKSVLQLQALPERP